jgi:hypothetical protein
VSLYVVTIPVTVETYARSPRAAVEQADRAISSESSIAVRVHPDAELDGAEVGRVRVRLWRPSWFRPW